MGIPSVFVTGKSGLMAAKSGIATSGHNISNANTDGYSRQRVNQSAFAPAPMRGDPQAYGKGVVVNGVERINDSYLERQIRGSNRELEHFEEKSLSLKQAEDIFNELNGDGLNRLMSSFFNEFRKLGNEPQNSAVREAVRESSKALTADFRRIRSEVMNLRNNLDNKVDGYVREINRLSTEVRDLNIKINQIQTAGGSPNDLMDQRDMALKELSSYMDMRSHNDERGRFIVDIIGVGPLISGTEAEQFEVKRTPADDQGKTEGAFDVHTTANANSNVTHVIRGGKMGAVLRVRDQVVTTVLARLDSLAKTVVDSVNQVHRQGYGMNNTRGMNFFKPVSDTHRAAEFIDISDEIRTSASNIAAAAQVNAPGDNRIAVAISGLQDLRLMDGGKATMDTYYNSMVSDIGVAKAHNDASMNQQKDIVTQLDKMREQISGVSIDEETTNLLQYQQIFDASAKVIQVADDMLETVLSLKR